MTNWISSYQNIPSGYDAADMDWVKWAEGDVQTLQTTQIAVSVEDYEINKKNRKSATTKIWK